MTPKRRKLSTVLAAVFLAVLALLAWKWLDSQSALWRIVSTSCVPAARSGGTGRCVEVALQDGVESGHVVFKDRVGPLQYLLMPSKQVQGVEDPFLLSAHAPNYWAKGWHAKRWMELAHGGPVPRDAISITLNSFWGRTQNQLHLHISCVRDDLRAFLRSLPDSIHDTWTAVPGGWQGHPYEVRKVFAETLDGENLFKDVARDRSDNMAQQGIAAVATQFGERHGFWLMRTQLDMKSLWHASIEGDVQDHACRVLAAK